MAYLDDKNYKDSAVAFLHQIGAPSQVIYCICITFVLISIALLPFIQITVSVKGQGTLRSNLEKIEIFAPITGIIKNISAEDNKRTTRGKILLTIDQTSSHQQKNVLTTRKKDLSLWLRDAQQAAKMLSLDLDNPSLSSGLYLASWQQFKEQQKSALNAKHQAQKIFDRYETLFLKKVITLSEYEQYRFNLEQSSSELKLVSKRYKTQWQTEAKQYQQELTELNRQQILLSEQQLMHKVISPSNGFMQNLTGLQTGSFVYANQKLFEISPDTTLIAFCYLSPSDIGLIKKGQTVRFQINAFNYNQWGMLTGKVIDISEDVVLQNQALYFKVKCSLDQSHLKLKNGYKGYLKQGMTFTASFTIAKRSLFQLLYDKIDNWVNPTIQNK